MEEFLGQVKYLPASGFIYSGEKGKLNIDVRETKDVDAR